MERPGGSDDRAAVIYGVHAVREVLRSRARPVSRIVLTRRDATTADVVQLARGAGIPVHVEQKETLDRLVPAGKHQGIVAFLGQKAYVQLDDVLERALKGEPAALLVILDGVQDPMNLGAIIRTAEAAGAHGIVIPDRRASGLTGVVAKASAGALEHMEMACVSNLSRTIERMQARGLWVYAIDPRAAKVYTELDLKGPIALVLGSEGTGIRRGVLETCDDRARIPMAGSVGSLNVSAAAAVALFEVVRQRRQAG